MTEHNNEQEKITSFVVKKIYDPFLRFLHVWNGLSVFSLMLTIWLKGFVKPYPNGPDIIYRFHVFIGYALTAGILARIIWGFIGSEHARFKNMWFFYDWIKVLKTKKLENTPRWGHDKYASIVYLFFYLMMLYQVISGLALAARRFGIGPFSSFVMQAKEKTPFMQNLKQIHEIVFYIFMGYIVLHVGMIIFHEITQKYPIAQSMFSGIQYRKPKK